MYEQELYVVVHTLRHWEYYLIPNQFVLYMNHQVLKYINSQKQISKMHAYWIVYLQHFPFMLKHKVRQQNKVANALHRQATLPMTMSQEVAVFEVLKDLYTEDDHFKETWTTCKSKTLQDDFHIYDGFLFKYNRLSIPHFFYVKS